MDATALIQRTLDHIEDNLCAQLTPQELADRAGFSLYHFQHLFRRIVGYPLQQYIRRRRLLHAVHAMRCGASGVNSALRYGFSTYSGFYRAFCREYGCTPAAYLRAGHAAHPRRIDLFKEVRIPMNPELAAEILQNWNLSHLPIQDVFYESTGERNEHAVYVGTDYVLKFSADPNKLLTNLQLASALEQLGLLAASPIPARSGETLVSHDNGCFFLSRRLPGSPLRAADLLGDPSHSLARQFGEHLGKLHLALSRIAFPVQEADPPTDTLSWSLPRVRDILPLPADFSRRITETLTALSPSLPRQIIHRDPNPSNVLVSPSGWSFIDFDLSQRSVRLIDPCYAATAVLSETIRSADAAKLAAWLSFYHSLLRGYDSTAHLTPEEKTALPYLLIANQFQCLAWFAEQPQYPDIFSANKRMTQWLLDHFDELPFQD